MKKTITFSVILLLLTSCVIIRKRYMNGYRIFLKSEARYMPPRHGAPRKEGKVNVVSKPDIPVNKPCVQEITNEDFLSCSSSNTLACVQPVSRTQPEPGKLFTGKKSTKRVGNFKFYEQKPVESKSSKPEPPDAWQITGKDKMVAILLCVFLGYLGIHRYYLGYTGIGCLYTLTCGLFLAGCSIDFIRLLTNDLEPKLSDYQKNIEHEIKKDPNLAGSESKENIIAEPSVTVKDAKNGLLELNLIYNSRYHYKPKSSISLSYYDTKYLDDSYNNPYYQKIPPYDSVKADALILERCRALGFKGYRKFSSFIQECTDKYLQNSKCLKYKTVIECQCTN